jgi:hypothetical protein
LAPEIKRLCKDLGFKNFPTPHFEEIDIRDASVWNRVSAQLTQLGILTPEECVQAIKTGRLPEPDESLESQNKFKEYKDDGLYAPIAAGGGAGAMGTGRPPGSKAPQTTKNVSPQGEKKAPAIASYSVKGISQAFKDYETLNAEVEDILKKKHKKKSLNEDQKIVAESIAKAIFMNEQKDSWSSCIKAYLNGEVKQNIERVQELTNISQEHSIDIFSAAILNYSQISREKV